MLRYSHRGLITALGLVVTLYCFAGCDLLTVADVARKQAKAEEDHEWGPFRMGMSLDDVQAIVKAKTGKPGKLERLPGSKWDSIFFEDKMLMLMDGVLMTVMEDDGNVPEDEPAIEP